MSRICPHCQKHNPEAASVSEKAVPKDGSLSFCIGCGRWAAFCDGARSLRLLGFEELNFVAHDPRCIAVRMAWKACRQ